MSQTHFITDNNIVMLVLYISMLLYHTSIIQFIINVIVHKCQMSRINVTAALVCRAGSRFGRVTSSAFYWTTVPSASVESVTNILEIVTGIIYVIF